MKDVFATVLQVLGFVFIGILILGAFAFRGSIFRTDAREQSFNQRIRQPQHFEKTLALMPSQSTDIPNSGFRRVEIRSEYPLRIMTGECQEAYTVQFFCNGDPHDIFITDTRRVPIFLTPRANNVTINVTEF